MGKGKFVLKKRLNSRKGRDQRGVHLPKAECRGNCRKQWTLRVESKMLCPTGVRGHLNERGRSEGKPRKGVKTSGERRKEGRAMLTKRRTDLSADD